MAKAHVRLRPYFLILAGVIGILVLELILLITVYPSLPAMLRGRKCESPEAILKRLGLTAKGTPLSQHSLQSGARMSVVNDAKVYRWTEQGWRLQENFCGGPSTLQRTLMQTPAGDVPLYTSNGTGSIPDSLLRNRRPGSVPSYLLAQLGNTPDSALLDIASGTGVISLAAAALRYRVVAVESRRKYALRMCKSIENGGLSDKVTLLFAKVGGKRSSSEDTNSRNISRKKTWRSKRLSKRPPAETVLMDDIISFFTAKTVLINVPGATNLVETLTAGARFFETFHVPLVLTRWGGTGNVSRETTVRQYFSKRHYVPYTLSRGAEMSSGRNTAFAEFVVWKQSKKENTYARN